MRAILKRRSLVKWAAVAVVAGVLPVEAAKKDLPNILIITTDQQFADVMGCAGSKWVKTPAMDSIAKDGVRFPNAYVNYPVCMPERYTMYTGRLPCQRYLADKNDKPVISLGNQARAAGYETAYFGKWHIQDETFGSKDSKFNGFDHYSGGKDKTMTANALEFLAGERKKPFLAVVSYYNPHDICEWGRKKAGRTEGIKMKNGEVDTDPALEDCPPLPHNHAINGDESEAVVIRRGLDSKGVANAQKMAMAFDGEDWRQYRWAYNRLVELVDGHIGALLEGLKENGHARDTVVIFTSDHGDGYGAHRWHQKSVLYEESCRVPFIVRYPGKGRRGETDDRLISVGIDLMATVSDIAGVPMPKGPYFGKSVLPFVLDKDSKAPSHEYVVTEAEVRVSKRDTIEGRSLRTPKFKYHVWNRGENREQLFDMEGDPGEMKNLAGSPEYAGVLEEHRRLFGEWLEKTDDTYRGE
ncbi:MAG: sulfatase family protein [Verrucomicrobiota bacterium JB025]|nr:sulfatase-like hydrolase/transferase [Verrucomicrobiota bacterium JB025]